MEPLIGCKDPLDLHGFLSKPHETLITTTCEGKRAGVSRACVNVLEGPGGPGLPGRPGSPGEPGEPSVP